MEPQLRPDPPEAVRFEVVDARSAEAQAAMIGYFAELDGRFPDGFDPGDALTAGAAGFDPPDGVFLLVRADGEAVGCGGLQALDPAIAEIKRMWIAPDWRGRGLAGELLRQLERHAVDLGYERVRLDTNAVLVEAIAMYERHGYRAIERYNDNPYAQRWFEKPLR